MNIKVLKVPNNNENLLTLNADEVKIFYSRYLQQMNSINFNRMKMKSDSNHIYIPHVRIIKLINDKEDKYFPLFKLIKSYLENYVYKKFSFEEILKGNISNMKDEDELFEVCVLAISDLIESYINREINNTLNKTIEEIKVNYIYDINSFIIFSKFYAYDTITDIYDKLYHNKTLKEEEIIFVKEYINIENKLDFLMDSFYNNIAIPLSKEKVTNAEKNYINVKIEYHKVTPEKTKCDINIGEVLDYIISDKNNECPHSDYINELFNNYCNNIEEYNKGIIDELGDANEPKDVIINKKSFDIPLPSTSSSKINFERISKLIECNVNKVINALIKLID